VNQKHRSGVKVKGELRSKIKPVGIALRGIELLKTVAENIGRIYADAALDLAGDLVDVVDGPVGAMP
jgi:hypothetical protein